MPCIRTSVTRSCPWILTLLLAVLVGRASADTVVQIVGNEFQINGRPTYEGRFWNGRKIQGLLMNSRMVQGIFDDRNPATVSRWSYPDTGIWDPERNTNEFLAAMSSWRANGLLSFTLNLQGGSPEGYSQTQPWINSAFQPDGSLRSDYFGRLERILTRADELGMVVILGYFYFGQDERLSDEAAVIQAVDNATLWILQKGYRNVIVEVNNECDLPEYDHAILGPNRVHELIRRIRNTVWNGQRLLVSTSYGGGTVPDSWVIGASDFVLLHGNAVSDPGFIAEMVRSVRGSVGYTTKPILFNEDDHFDFDLPVNNFVMALSEYASWGFFDPDGYQRVPVNWGINTSRKQSFFGFLSLMTQAPAAPPPAPPPATGVDVSVSSSTPPPGSTVTVSFSGIQSPTSTDWIGLAPAGASLESYWTWKYAGSCSQSAGAAKVSGSCLFAVPTSPGSYEFRLFSNDGYWLLDKVAATVTAQTPPPSPPPSPPPPTGVDISVSVPSAPPGSTVTVSFSGITNPSATDWIGFAPAGASLESYWDWKYAGSCGQWAGGPKASGSCTFTLPMINGPYELRLFSNDGYGLLAKAPVTVSGLVPPGEAH
jgi:hypothetical protein